MEDERKLSNALEQQATLSAAPQAQPTTPMPHPKHLPTTLTRSYRLLGIHTDCWVQLFADRIVIGVTQRQQKIGNWCLCQANQSVADPTTIDFQLDTVLGDRMDSMLGVYTRRVTERLITSRNMVIPASTNPNGMVVLMGISLKDQGKDPNMFQVVVEVLVQLVQDAITAMS